MGNPVHVANSSLASAKQICVVGMEEGEGVSLSLFFIITGKAGNGKMKRNGKVLKILGLGLFSVVMASCINIGKQIATDQPNLVVEEKLPPFSRVRVQGPFNIILTNRAEIASNMSRKAHQQVNFMVEDGTLIIRPNRQFYPSPSTRLFLYIGLAGVNELELITDGTLYTDGTLQGQSMSMVLGGAVIGRLESAIKNLQLEVRTPRQITLTGEAEVLRVHLHAGSTLSIRNFRAGEIEREHIAPSAHLLLSR